jgi:hypothetical protein
MSDDDAAVVDGAAIHDDDGDSHDDDNVDVNSAVENERHLDALSLRGRGESEASAARGSAPSPATGSVSDFDATVADPAPRSIGRAASLESLSGLVREPAATERMPATDASCSPSASSSSSNHNRLITAELDVSDMVRTDSLPSPLGRGKTHRRSISAVMSTTLESLGGDPDDGGGDHRQVRLSPRTPRGSLDLDPFDLLVDSQDNVRPPATPQSPSLEVPPPAPQNTPLVLDGGSGGGPATLLTGGGGGVGGDACRSSGASGTAGNNDGGDDAVKLEPLDLADMVEQRSAGRDGNVSGVKAETGAQAPASTSSGRGSVGSPAGSRTLRQHHRHGEPSPATPPPPKRLVNTSRPPLGSGSAEESDAAAAVDLLQRRLSRRRLDAWVETEGLGAVGSLPLSPSSATVLASMPADDYNGNNNPGDDDDDDNNNNNNSANVGSPLRHVSLMPTLSGDIGVLSDEGDEGDEGNDDDAHHGDGGGNRTLRSTLSVASLEVAESGNDADTTDGRLVASSAVIEAAGAVMEAGAAAGANAVAPRGADAAGATGATSRDCARPDSCDCAAGAGAGAGASCDDAVCAPAGCSASSLRRGSGGGGGFRISSLTSSPVHVAGAPAAGVLDSPSGGKDVTKRAAGPMTGLALSELVADRTFQSRLRASSSASLLLSMSDLSDRE